MLEAEAFLIASEESRPLKPNAIKPFSDGETERNAQSLVDYPDASTDRALYLEELLRERWSQRLELDRQGTEYKIARTVRKLAFAATSSLIYTQLLHEIVPDLEQGTFKPALYATETFQPGPKTPLLHGSAAVCCNSLFQFFKNRGGTHIERLSNPHHLDHRIWQTFDDTQLWMKYTSPYPATLSDGRSSWDAAVVDSARVFTASLLYAGHAYSMTNSNFPPKDKLTKNALRSLDQLTWPATASSVTQKLFHNVQDSIGSDFFQFEDAELTSTKDFMPNRKPALLPSARNLRICQYDEPSLMNGPWRQAGRCPAVPVIQPRAEEDRDIVERFFKYFEDQYDIPIFRLHGEDEAHKGAFDRVTVGLLISILYARATIYDHWPRLRQRC